MHVKDRRTRDELLDAVSTAQAQRDGAQREREYAEKRIEIQAAELLRSKTEIELLRADRERLTATLEVCTRRLASPSRG